MSYFVCPLVIKQINRNTWKVVHSFSYVHESGNMVEKIGVPGGFVTDGASIPRLLWTVVGHPLGKYAQAAVLHDYLYYRNMYTRKKCDNIFLDGMKTLKVNYIKRYAMYYAVRAISWIPWNYYRRQNSSN